MNGANKSRSSRRRRRWQIFILKFHSLDSWSSSAAQVPGLELFMRRAIPDGRDDCCILGGAILCHTLYSISNVNSSSGGLFIRSSSSSKRGSLSQVWSEDSLSLHLEQQHRSSGDYATWFWKNRSALAMAQFPFQTTRLGRVL